LVNFSLSSDEWREYKTMPAGDNDGLLSFESFYLHAEARDQALTNNLISQLKKNEASTAVLVTGGFHSSGVQNRLLAAGFNVVTFVPKISKIESEAGTSYLSVFTQEKTSLDKLFEGEKLFVSPNPFQVAPLPFAAAALTGAQTPNTSLTESERSELRMLGLPDWAMIHDVTDAQVRIDAPQGSIVVNLTNNNDPEIAGIKFEPAVPSFANRIIVAGNALAGLGTSSETRKPEKNPMKIWRGVWGRAAAYVIGAFVGLGMLIHTPSALAQVAIDSSRMDQKEISRTQRVLGILVANYNDENQKLVSGGFKKFTAITKIDPVKEAKKQNMIPKQIINIHGAIGELYLENGQPVNAIAIHPEAFTSDAHLLADLAVQMETIIVMSRPETQGQFLSRYNYSLEIQSAERALLVLERIANDSRHAFTYYELRSDLRNTYIPQLKTQLQQMKDKESEMPSNLKLLKKPPLTI
jgi:hypothetical protein